MSATGGRLQPKDGQESRRPAGARDNANPDRFRDEQAEPQPESTLFAGYVAHELRTPLATQRALLELALSDPSTDTGNWRQVAADLLDACKQQERLLNACLVLARSQSGLCRRETRDLGSIVAKRLRAGDLGGVTVRSALDTASVIGDPDLIERLVDNLVGNAIRHNRPGGWIKLSTRRLAAKALFTIENTGPTVPPGEVTRLLEPFEQLAGQNARPAGGLGLGLTVAKAVADAHGALIAARARPRGGLRVQVAFQAQPGKPRC